MGTRKGELVKLDSDFRNQTYCKYYASMYKKTHNTANSVDDIAKYLFYEAKMVPSYENLEDKTILIPYKKIKIWNRKKSERYWEQESKRKPVVLLNKPVTDAKDDWLGVNTDVDKIEEGIISGANIIGVVSSFGTGKSSVISMLSGRHKLFMGMIGRWRISTINMWKEVESMSALNELAEDDADSHLNNSNTRALHQSLVYNMVSQVASNRGRYVSRRFNGAYGIIAAYVEGKAQWLKLLACVTLLFAAEVNRRYFLITPIDISDSYFKIMIASYVSAIVIAAYTICHSEILFSSKNSQGLMKDNENELMDLYSRFILQSGFFRRYVFCIEDLDRIENKDEVLKFIKELRRYYLADRSFKTKIKFNKITFIICIKPEALLYSKRADDEDIFPKIFDCVIELNKINMMDYDSFLNLLIENDAKYLRNIGLLSENSKPIIDNISGMEWVIRGKVDIRKIKIRYNKAVSLYEKLSCNYGYDKISFMKCGVAIYLKDEYSNEIYSMEDDRFDSTIDQILLSRHDKATLKNYDSDFEREVYRLVVNNLIETDYRLYFYSNPINQRVYSNAEELVYRELLNPKISVPEQTIVKAIEETNEDVIVEAYNRIIRLDISFPMIIFQSKKLFIIAMQIDMERAINTLFSNHITDENERLEKIINSLNYSSGIDKQSHIWNLLAEGTIGIASKTSIIQIRKKFLEKDQNAYMCYKDLFHDNVPFLTKEEVSLIQSDEILLDCLEPWNITTDDSEVCRMLSKIFAERNIVDDRIDDFFEEYLGRSNINISQEDIYYYGKKTGHISQSVLQIIVDAIRNKKISPDLYVTYLSEKENILNEEVRALESINYRGKLDTKVVDELYNIGAYELYVYHSLVNHKIPKHLDNNDIINIFKTNGVSYSQKLPEGFELFRKNIAHSKEVEQYSFIFGDKYRHFNISLLSGVEIKSIVKILNEIDIVAEDISAIADIFNTKCRRGREAKEIYSYVLSMPKPLVRDLFYKINPEKVVYSNLSKDYRTDFTKRFISLINPGNTLDERIRFIEHIKCNEDIIEKNLYKELNEPGNKEYMTRYVDVLNSMSRVSKTAIDNLCNLNTKYGLNKTICTELFKRGEYKTYVVASTLYMQKFVEETNKELEGVYVEIFNNNQYKNTIKYMKANESFMQRIVSARCYERIDDIDEMSNYSAAKQDKNILEYVFKSFPVEEQIEYLSQITIGFENREAACYVVERIINTEQLLKSEDVYEAVYNHLIDPGLKGKYTKRRNNLFR